MYVCTHIYIYVYICTGSQHTLCDPCTASPHTPCGGGGVTFHVLDVSHEKPDVTPCHTSPPQGVLSIHEPRTSQSRALGNSLRT